MTYDKRRMVGIDRRKLNRLSKMRVPVGASAILSVYGAVAPQHRPEDWTAVRAEVEQMIADEVAGEG